ncbi:MAG TPA: hypothetical protein PKL31_02110 [Fulvivirga sp.]|nr:hypothetical protein [Fulvivirga sp.]
MNFGKRPLELIEPDGNDMSTIVMLIVRKTVEKLSGSISLESTENKGSKFSIEFPA